MVNTNTGIPVSEVPLHIVEQLKMLSVATLSRQVSDVLITDSSGVLQAYASALADNFADVKMGSRMEITTEALVAYLNTLLLLRVMAVRNDRRRQDWLRLCPFPTVPAFFFAYLSKIGVASDEGLNIELWPKFEPEEDSIILPDDFQRFSYELTRYKNAGFDYSDELPRHPKGSWEVMSMQMLQMQLGFEVVRHEGDKTHNVFALFSSMYQQRFVETILLPRVTYGPSSYFKGLVRTLAGFRTK